MNKDIVRLIRERFYPLVRFCGPQSLREVEVEGVRETVYLGELSIWLWPAKTLTMAFCPMKNSAIWLSHIYLFRNLLLQAHRSMAGLLFHLTGLKRPTEIPCHACPITSKIPLER